MDIYDFCGRLDIWNISMGWYEDSGSFPFGGEFVLWRAEVNSFGYHWFLQTVLTSDMRWSNFTWIPLYGAAFWCSFCRGCCFRCHEGLEKCLVKPEGFPPVCVFWDWVFWYSPPSDEETSWVTWWPEIGSRSDGQLKVLVSDGGEISKTLFWVFSPVSWVIWMFWFLDLKWSMKIDFIWSCETRNWLLKSGNRVSETKLYDSHVASRFSQEVNWS